MSLLPEKCQNCEIIRQAIIETGQSRQKLDSPSEESYSDVIDDFLFWVTPQLLRGPHINCDSLDCQYLRLLSDGDMDLYPD